MYLFVIILYTIFLFIYVCIRVYIYIWGFPKMVVPNNHGFPTKNDHFGVFWGYHHLRKYPYIYIYVYLRMLLVTPYISLFV